MQYPLAARQIIALKDADLRLRDRLLAEGRLNDGYDGDMANLHRRNADQLRDIVENIGLPTAERVGRDASAAAWLVAQHAIGSPDFLRYYARLLCEAAATGKADPVHLAYLTDRIAVFEGCPQRYGTQFDWDDKGELNPHAYDDRTLVDERRRELGLPPLKEQTKLLRGREDNRVPPGDLRERRAAYEAWREQVGWR